MAKGFVYVLSNPAFPGLLKVGFSRKMPEERALELDTTGVPSAFVVEYYCIVDGDAELEGRVHRLMASKRHREGREFFRAELGEVIETIQGICSPEHVWSRVPLKKARPALVKCPNCGAGYAVATHCPKCRIKLEW